MKKGISRRDFLKYLGVGAAGTALFEGATPAFAEENLPSFELGPFKLKKTKETASGCSYCGCGCSTIVYSENDKVVFIEGDPDSPINEGALCPKGMALTDVYTIVDKNHQRVPNPNRLTKVLYRAPGGTQWEEKTWDWAIPEIAKRVKKTRDEHFEEKDDKGVTVNRTMAICQMGSANINNEEDYLVNKLMRGSLGVVDLDHCARL
ncbi:MAG: twin-arginine translocation signal domain-containing protein [Desulfotomaculaceae bacterium]|nr:twin-arginine translocation signal domain-containing protein [Desulfotomaculaceae bacterium]